MQKNTMIVIIFFRSLKKLKAFIIKIFVCNLNLSEYIRKNITIKIKNKNKIPTSGIDSLLITKAAYLYETADKIVSNIKHVNNARITLSKNRWKNKMHLVKI